MARTTELTSRPSCPASGNSLQVGSSEPSSPLSEQRSTVTNDPETRRCAPPAHHGLGGRGRSAETERGAGGRAQGASHLDERSPRPFEHRYADAVRVEKLEVERRAVD